MKWIDTRRLALVAALLAAACVPTVLHSYVGMTVSDGRDVTQIPMTLNGLAGRATERRPASVLNAYATTDFIERKYGSSTLFIARSFDAKPLYHHPELAVAHGDSYARAVVTRPTDHPDIPIFVLEGTGSARSVYALLYGDEFIDSPIRFQLQNALRLLFRPKAQTTLFFVRSNAEYRDTSHLGLSGEVLLLSAIDSFRAQATTGER